MSSNSTGFLMEAKGARGERGEFNIKLWALLFILRKNLPILNLILEYSMQLHSIGRIMFCFQKSDG